MEPPAGAGEHAGGLVVVVPHAACQLEFRAELLSGLRVHGPRLAGDRRQLAIGEGRDFRAVEGRVDGQRRTQDVVVRTAVLDDVLPVFGVKTRPRRAIQLNSAVTVRCEIEFLRPALGVALPERDVVVARADEADRAERLGEKQVGGEAVRIPGLFAVQFLVAR